MAKVISFDEFQQLWQKDKEKAVSQFAEQYEVRYEFQKDDGFWSKDKMLFCSFGKNNHSDVEKEFKVRFPKAKIISVHFQ